MTRLLGDIMEAKPWRSWSKTYTQGWSLAMHESNQVRSSSASNNTGKPQRDWKDDCCRKFNKNKCGKPANACIYYHRCTFCGVWNHGFHNCRKRLGKASGRNGNHGGRIPLAATSATGESNSQGDGGSQSSKNSK